MNDLLFAGAVILICWMLTVEIRLMQDRQQLHHHDRHIHPDAHQDEGPLL